MTPAPHPLFAAPDAAGAERRSLVLAGGGMRVAYQAGVIVALEEAGLRFQHIDGASGGTMNLSMLLGGQGGLEMCERWRTLDPRTFSAPLPWCDYVRSLRWPSLGSGRGLRDKVFPHLGIDADLVRRARDVVGTYNVCNFAAKTAEVVEHTEVDDDLLVAAVSLPVLMPAVERRGVAYTDAVWIRDSNVPEAVRRGSDDIWLVWCIGNTARYHRGLFRQYVHMIEMAATGSLRRDLNEVAARWPDRTVRLHVIKPESPIPLDPDYFLGRIDGSALVDLGYQDARRYLDRPQPHLIPPTGDPTAMREPLPGVAARLDLDGPFAFGTSDPLGGARHGTEAATSVHLHLRIVTEDSRCRPADGALRAAGDVSLPGRPHVLLGPSEVDLGPPGPTLRLSLPGDGRWLRVAPGDRGGCLEVRVHDGAPDGPVAGAGLLDLGWPQVARTLASIHPTDSINAWEGFRARAAMAAAVVGVAGVGRPRAPGGERHGR